MKQQSVITMLCLYSIVFYSFSCKKSGSENPPPPTVSAKTKLLGQQPWVIAASIESFNNIVWTDAFSGIADCSKDNHYEWAIDGTYNYNEGPTKCNSIDRQVYEEGTWKFTTSDENVVSMKNSDGIYDDFLILKLGNDSLKVSGDYISGAGTTIFTQTSFVHP